VSTLPKSTQSDTITQALTAAGGWGFGSFRIDFSIEVLEADASTPFRTFTPTDDFYSPDCDHVPFPVPPGGALEGETGYQCVSDGDCHLIVVHRPTKTLYEMWRANIVGSTFSGGCAAKWDLTRAYPATLRGDQCSSADAGGFPMAAMLFSADEVASGAINHAIRFILPNSRMRSGVYVRPASHAGGPSGEGLEEDPAGRVGAAFAKDDVGREVPHGPFAAQGGCVGTGLRHLVGQRQPFGEGEASHVGDPRCPNMCDHAHTGIWVAPTVLVR